MSAWIPLVMLTGLSLVYNPDPMFEYRLLVAEVGADGAQSDEEQGKPEPDAPTKEAEPPPTTTTPPPPPPPPTATRTVWDDLADCESGNWIDRGASFEKNSARWDWAKPGTKVPPWGTTIHHGGLQHHPGTWDAFKGKAGVDVDYAYNATREQQIAVATEVQKVQGWGAWPTCARKLNLLP